jgi:MFS family permease
MSLTTQQKPRLKDLPRNIWAVSLASFFMDISSEMVINLVPLFLQNVLGVKTAIIGVIEGVAETTASVLKLFAGWISDKLKSRKWLAVLGYGISALAKPFFYIANTWGIIAGVRWADRVGKGIRTSPRDALVADSIDEKRRGLAFGVHRTADTAGALLGILTALAIVWFFQEQKGISLNTLGQNTFKVVVLFSLLPAVLSVLSLLFGAKDVQVRGQRALPKFGFKSLGKNFIIFVIIVGIFTLGNSSDAFLTLRAQNQGKGLNLIGILAMLVCFNLVYSLTSMPAGILSDKLGRKKLLITGWTIYTLVYLGFGFSTAGWHFFVLYMVYGFYYGLTYGTINALITDIVPENMRGTAYGTYNFVVGIMAFPASVIAGVLWQGVGKWAGFGAPAPFIFGGTMALFATVLLIFWFPEEKILKNIPVQ